MPVLTYQLGDEPRAIPVLGTLSVGRDQTNDIVLRHPTVSRRHATLEVDESGAVWVADLGSSNGTQVDGVPVVGRRRLAVPCRLRVGRVRVWFREQTPSWLEGAAAGRIEPAEGLTELTAEGEVRRCACGGKMWLVPSGDGRRVYCRRCGRPVGPAEAQEAGDSVSGDMVSGETMDGAPAVAACPVCRWAVEPGDVTRRCEACETVYHAECWEQNRGCATFGCAEVGAEDVDRAPAEAEVAPPTDTASRDEYGEVDALTAARDSFDDSGRLALPAGGGLAALNLAATVIGLPTFGVPPLLTAAASAVLLKRRPGHELAGAAAAVIGLLGAAAGAAVSTWYWL